MSVVLAMWTRALCDLLCDLVSALISLGRVWCRVLLRTVLRLWMRCPCLILIRAWLVVACVGLKCVLKRLISRCVRIGHCVRALLTQIREKGVLARSRHP